MNTYKFGCLRWFMREWEIEELTFKAETVDDAKTQFRNYIRRNKWLIRGRSGEDFPADIKLIESV
jgi:hypothetical protein